MSSSGGLRPRLRQLGWRWHRHVSSTAKALSGPQSGVRKQHVRIVCCVWSILPTTKRHVGDAFTVYSQKATTTHPFWGSVVNPAKSVEWCHCRCLRHKYMSSYEPRIPLTDNKELIAGRRRFGGLGGGRGGVGSPNTSVSPKKGLIKAYLTFPSLPPSRQERKPAVKPKTRASVLLTGARV